MKTVKHIAMNIWNNANDNRGGNVKDMFVPIDNGGTSV